jgi:hypothetical protein
LVGRRSAEPQTPFTIGAPKVSRRLGLLDQEMNFSSLK